MLHEKIVFYTLRSHGKSPVKLIKQYDYNCSKDSSYFTCNRYLHNIHHTHPGLIVPGLMVMGKVLFSLGLRQQSKHIHAPHWRFHLQPPRASSPQHLKASCLTSALLSLVHFSPLPFRPGVNSTLKEKTERDLNV